MIDKTQFELMGNYNQWMNEKVYNVCADIPDEERRKDKGAFFKSIHGTLNHLMYGDMAWMGRFTDKPLQGVKIGEELYSSFDQLREERKHMDRSIVEWTKQLEEDWLAQPFTFISGVDGKSRTLPTWSLVTHMFNHQTHHRGQLTTLLSQMGFDIGSTDIPWLPRFQSD